MPTVTTIDVRQMHHGRVALTQVLELDAGWGGHDFGRGRIPRRTQGGEYGPRHEGPVQGHRPVLRLCTDSSAAVGICSRQGLGKLRHLECTSPWIQQRIRHGELEVRKIAGEFKPADLYTKHLESKAKIEQLVSLFGAEIRGGRA